MEAKNNNLEKKVTQLLSENESLRIENGKMNERISELEKQIKKIQTEKQQGEEFYFFAESDIRDLKAKNQKIDNENKELRAKLKATIENEKEKDTPII